MPGGALPATILEQIRSGAWFTAIENILAPSKDNCIDTGPRQPSSYSTTTYAADPLDAAAAHTSRSRRLRSSVHVLHHPQLREKFRSRRFESWCAKRKAWPRGVREVTLIGQTLHRTGKTLDFVTAWADARSLAGVEGLQWVRSLYCYRTRHAAAARYHRAHPALRNHGHAAAAREPQRPGSNEARSNGDAFLQLLDRIRKTIPGVALRTSFIVGFPGETMRTSRIVRSCKRRSLTMGVFQYSDVDNASSFALDEKVDEIQFRRQID